MTMILLKYKDKTDFILIGMHHWDLKLS